METLQRNQTFFPDYPGAPEVRIGIYHSTRHEKWQILSETSTSWPLTDVASDLGYHLSFAQGILWGIEYLCVHHSGGLDVAELQKLGKVLQETTSEYVLAYSDDWRLQYVRNRTFLQNVRSTLMSINKLSPEHQIRCRTHALPEQFDRDSNRFTPHRLGRSWEVLQFNALDATKSNEDKKMMVSMDMPLRNWEELPV